jgi:FtsZ-interacting cell division protein ZipA
LDLALRQPSPTESWTPGQTPDLLGNLKTSGQSPHQKFYLNLVPRPCSREKNEEEKEEEEEEEEEEEQAHLRAEKEEKEEKEGKEEKEMEEEEARLRAENEILPLFIMPNDENGGEKLLMDINKHNLQHGDNPRGTVKKIILTTKM